MSLIGIDVSVHNGDIDWGKIASQHIDFAIIRAGYGHNNIDSKAVQNILGCKNNHIPFGLYWFSYALNIEMARQEADFICDIADMHNPQYPIFYDWEYDSDRYATQNHINITNSTRASFAKTFLERVEERGYCGILYTNIDYLNKGFDELRLKYPIWLAQWDVSTPTKQAAIWQYSCKGRLEGVSTEVDMNVSKKDYTKYNENKMDFFVKASNEMWNKYTKLANEIIDGKYGNGETRKRRLREAGYDYELAQMFVNYILNG